MEYAWKREKRVLIRFFMFLGIVLVVGIIGCIGIISSFILDITKKEVILSIGSYIILAVALVSVIKMMIEMNLLFLFKYKVDSIGIKVIYNKKNMWIHSWENVSEISVCDVHHATRGDAFDFVIRIVIGEELDGPRNKNCKKNLYGYERWRNDTYEAKHWKKLVVIEYTPERYLEIKEASGMEIKDYRRPYSDAWKIKVPEN